MATRTFSFEIQGTAAGGQTWTVTGRVMDTRNDLPAVFENAMRSAFLKLTEGKAIFGQPGVGCSGPYNIKKIVIEQK